MFRNRVAHHMGRLAAHRPHLPPSRNFSHSPKLRSAPQNRHQPSPSASPSRIDRITARLPRRLQKYTAGLRDAPVSHVVSFLILHEITAVVPLLALVGLFHYTNYAPVSYMTGHFGSYVEMGITRFERYFRRKGYFGFSREAGQDGQETASAGAGVDGQGGATRHTTEAVEKWKSGDSKYQLLVEVALAYAITKALLPVRIIGSVWATPWFAGVLTRARTFLSRK